MQAFSFVYSPIGRIMLTTEVDALTGLYMDVPRGWPSRTHGHIENASAGMLPVATRQLEEYFAGRRRHFELPLRMHGTLFQRRVWQALLEIGYGETWSYAEIARRIDNPTACRAVGLANGSNPISIIVPCHRVIGANGSLTGYGGGIERKQWLLGHEGWARGTRKARPVGAGAAAPGVVAAEDMRVASLPLL